MSENYTNENSGQDYEQSENVVSGGRTLRKRKRRRKKHYLLKLLIFLFLCGGIYMLLHSSVFTLEKIQISETQYFTAAEIQETAGIEKGMNLFDFKAGKGEEALQADPHIKAANIKRGLPDAVKIEIEERIEAATIKTGTEYAIIDDEGMILRVTDKAPNLLILEKLVITSDPKAGDVVKVEDKTALKRSLEVLQSVQRNELDFKGIDASRAVVKIHVRDKLYCSGKAKNLVLGMEEGDLQAVLKDLKGKETKKGMISVGENKYFSFNKKL